MLARLTPILAVGGLDERFFLYSEEPDLCLRMRRHGWETRHLPLLTVVHHGRRIGLAVGGFFDFAAGVVPRAPAWMNRAGLEWAFRLACEPRRLAGRYLIGIPKFLWQVARAPAPPAAASRSDLGNEHVVEATLV